MKNLKSINWSKVAFPLILAAGAFVTELTNSRREEKIDKLIEETEMFHNAVNETYKEIKTEQEEEA